MNRFPCRPSVPPGPPGPAARFLAALAFLCLTGAVALAGSASMSVTLNRNRIYLGESVILSIQVSGADGDTTPDLGGIRKCNIRALGSRDISNYSVVFVNGVMRREGFSGRVFSYELTPQEAGEITAGPIRVTAGGSVLSDPGPAITVTGVTQQELVSIAVAPSRDAVLVDEPFDIRLTVRMRRLPAPFADTDPLFPGAPPVLQVPFIDPAGINGLQGPNIEQLLQSHLVRGKNPGFAINEYTTQNDPFDFGSFLGGANPFERRAAVFRLDRGEVTKDGQSFFEYSLTLSYQPQEEGNYTFGPVIFKGNVPVSVSARGEATGREIFAVGPAATVRVVPPPEEDKPVSYIGAVGSNLVVEAALDAQTCNVGDPLTLTLSVEGGVQMRNVFPPRLSLQTNVLAHFEVYDDTVQTVKKDAARRFVYTLRPRHAGGFELPPIAVSYYDAVQRRYRTVRTTPVPLKVRQALEVTASQVIGLPTNAPLRDPRPAAQPLGAAGMRLDPAGADPAPLIGRPFALGLTAATGPAVFLLTLGVVHLLRRRTSFALALQRRRAFDRALTALKQAERSAASTPSALHSAVCQVARQYLEERLSLKASAATPSDVRTILAAAGIPRESADRFAAVFERHFNAAFGTPAADRTAKQEIDEVRQAIAGLENALSRRTPGRPAVSAAALMLLLALASASSVREAAAATPSERQFLWNEANARFMAARTPEDYLETARIYQRLVDLDVRNSSVFYNYGTALLLAGRNEDAVQVLLRAERYDGGSADIAHNLAVARARRDNAKTPVTPWTRIALFWHFALPCTIRAGIAAAAFSLLWLAIAARLAGWRRGTGTVLTIAILLLVLFGSSVLATWQGESAATRPILTAVPPR